MRSSDSNRNLVAIIAYIPVISIFCALAILFVEKDDKFIRFHALQAVLIYMVYILVWIIVVRLPFGNFLNGLVSLVFFAVWLISCYKAWQGEVFKWPIVGDWAEKRVR
ncbi:MAG: DUF4870 domain-containing protein [Candidatus Paceibacterales bacterium]